MKMTRHTMGMPVTVEIIDPDVTTAVFEDVLRYFQQIDERFSPYKPTSELSLINAGRLQPSNSSNKMKAIFALAAQTKQETNGYFDIRRDEIYDPSGIVKGWAIWQAALQLKQRGYQNFYLDIGSDIEVAGHNATGQPWRIGIRHPFKPTEIVKVLALSGHGVATSGTYERGQHIYNPHQPKQSMTDIISLTVIGPNVCEADRFATAAFAMGKNGIAFIENLPDFEGYMIDKTGIATQTSGFEQFVIHV